MTRQDKYRKIFQSFIDKLSTKKRILFLTTSTRWSGEHDNEFPKSTQLAHLAKEKLGDKVEIIDVAKLKIYPCEGNVSTARGNTCGLKGATLLDKSKNPTGQIRCWAAFNNPDDELYKIANAILASDCVVFFASVRWGQANGMFQKLIERLTWLENRHTTLGEDNLLAEKSAGFVIVGQNWRAKDIVQIEKGVLEYYGFKIEDELFWHWQFGNDSHEEDDATYQNAAHAFHETFFSQ